MSRSIRACHWPSYIHNVGVGIFIAAFVGQSPGADRVAAGVGFLLFDVFCLTVWKTALYRRKSAYRRIMRRARLGSAAY